MKYLDVNKMRDKVPQLVLDWVLIEMVLGLGVQDPKIDKPHRGNPVCLQDAG